MKPIIPDVPLSVWKDLYSAVQQVSLMKPWETLDDFDLIGIRDPLTGETGYGVFMGSGGMSYGFCLYRGAEGFHFYHQLALGKIDIKKDDVFAIQHCIMLELCSRKELDSEDRRVIGQLGLTYKGEHAWPEFRSMIPGYALWYLTESEARFLTTALIAGCVHCEKVNAGEFNDSWDEKECLVYTNGNAAWEPHPILEREKSPVTLDLARITRLRSMKLNSDSPWEIGDFYLPTPILDRDRPYLPRLGIICHQSSGIVYAPVPMLPESNIHQMLADSICTVIEQLRLIPEIIYMKNAETCAALTPLAKALGTTIKKKKNLAAVNDAKNSFMEHFVHSGGKRR